MIALALRRLIRRRAWALWLVPGACLVPSASMAADDCLAPNDRAAINQTYAKYVSQFDPPAIAQRLLVVLDKAGDAKESLALCKKAHPGKDPESCGAIAGELQDHQKRLDALTERLYFALGMQQYMTTLKLRLEQPDCK